MEQVIIIRMGEIFLKGRNKKFFENILKSNIRTALDGYTFKLHSERNRMIICDYLQEYQSQIVSRLIKVFGIHSVSIGTKTRTSLDEIAYLCLKNSPNSGTFRITVNRADKSIQKTSIQIATEIGAYMLKHSNNLVVNLHIYDFEVFVDIRENGYTYIFSDRIMGAGGLPVGCSGKGMLLLSGGIDSPVSAYKIAKRGVQIFAVHFHSFPYTSQKAKEKVIDLSNELSAYCGSIELNIVPFTDIQCAIRDKCSQNYTIALMRRFMIRIAEKIALNKNCGALITGESLGQVASQTMESIACTDDAVSLPIYRPLIGSDKLEIINCAKHIGTYDLSILPYEDCCTVFVPESPIIKPKLNYIIEMESRLDVEKLINEAISNVEVINCNGK